MTTLALRTVPGPGSIILNQARALFLNRRWELLFMGTVIFIYHLATMNAARDESYFHEMMMFNDGALGLPMQVIFILFGAFWAFRIWEGLRPGEGSTLFTYPAGRLAHQVLRITAGLIVLTAVLAFFWLLGATVAEIVTPGYSWFSAPEYNGPGWTVTLFGTINAYLYATILALLFRRPEIWFLVWIPISVSVLLYLLYRTGLDFFGDVLSSLLSWPSGATAGLGLARGAHHPGPRWELPSLGVLLTWTVIFAIGVWLTARVHREE